MTIRTVVVCDKCEVSARVSGVLMPPGFSETGGDGGVYTHICTKCQSYAEDVASFRAWVIEQLDACIEDAKTIEDAAEDFYCNYPTEVALIASWREEKDT